MTLDDLLQTLREDILHDRSDQIDGVSDRLWSDTTLVRYIDQAQRRFARRSLCIRDGTTDQFTKVATVAAQDEYPLDPGVVAVISARFMGNGSTIAADVADLARSGHAQLSTYHIPDSYFFDPSQLSQLPPGKPLVIA